MAADAVVGHNTVASRPLLHVLAGPNRGAEAPLDAGVWIIGTGADADLTFAEPALAEKHVRISISPGGARLIALAGDVRVGLDTLTADEECDLPLLCPVAIGGTVFAIGPAGSDWAAIRSQAEQALPAVETPAAPAPAKAVGAKDTPARSAATANAGAPAIAARKRFRPGGWLLPLVGIGILLLAGFVTLATFSVRPPPPAPARDPLAAARAIIAQLHLPEVTASMAGKRLVVGGYAATNGQIGTLADALRQQGINADMRVTSEAALVDSTTTVLKAYGLGDVTVKAAGPGRVTLAGYTDAALQLKDVMRRLQTDVVGLRVVVDQVATLQRAQQALEQALSAAGLGGIVRLSTSPRAIKAAGFLDPAGMAKWTPIADRFRKDYGAFVRLDARVVALSGPVPRGVRLGRTSYVILDDGSRLGVGDTLGHGGQILAITADGLRVRTASGDVDMPFARPPNWIVMEDKK